MDTQNLTSAGFNRIQLKDITYFKSILGEEAVLTTVSDKQEYSQDYSGHYTQFLADCVLIVESKHQIIKIVKYCNEHTIPLTVRASGTSLSSSTVPVFGGVILSIVKLNKIVDIDLDNLQVTVEPGVITESISIALESHGLFYPPDPASKGSCTIGGNIAHSSGGPHALKYGTTKDYVLNLEVVLPNGQVIWTGANTLKNSTGYNLTQLMIGSEGTLGIITQIVLRVIPLPKFTTLLSANFDSLKDACQVVSEIFKGGIQPSAVEFIERNAILYTSDFLKIPSEISLNTQAQLIIELDGFHQEIQLTESEKINALLEKYGCQEVKFATSDAEKNQIWNLRRKIGEAIRASTVFMEEDTVVPRSKLPELVAYVKDLELEYGFQTVCFGHAGDGNMHINILKNDLSEKFWKTRLQEPIRKLFLKVKELGGTISGEHGIGYSQKQYMDVMFSDSHFELFKGIKSVFDPKGILNPGKIF